MIPTKKIKFDDDGRHAWWTLDLTSVSDGTALAIVHDLSRPCDLCGGDGFISRRYMNDGCPANCHYGRHTWTVEVQCDQCGGEGSQPVPHDEPCDTCRAPKYDAYVPGVPCPDCVGGRRRCGARKWRVSIVKDGTYPIVEHWAPGVGGNYVQIPRPDLGASFAFVNHGPERQNISGRLPSDAAPGMTAVRLRTEAL